MIKLGNVSQNYTKRPPREGPILETSESLHHILDLRGRSGRQAARFQGITLVVDMMLEKTKTNLLPNHRKIAITTTMSMPMKEEQG